MPTFHLVIDKAAVASLKKKPKKFVRGSFTYAGVTYADVGVRLKGHRALKSLDEKPAFKISFDKFVPGRRFLGLANLTLNNLAEDPSMMREALAYKLFAAMDVPAPRTGYAELIVNGQLFGLYLNVESADDVFLDRVLPAAGALYEGEYGCDLYPDDVPGFEVDAGSPDGSRAGLASLAAAAEQGRALELVDRKRVSAFLATSAVIGDFDGYRHSHNYRIADSPSGWVLVPWGLDRTFKKRLALDDSNGVLARACFAEPTCKAEFLRSARVAAASFESEALLELMDQIAHHIGGAVKRDRRKAASDSRTADARAALKRFIRERPAEIQEQSTCIGEGGRDIDADGDGRACTDCDDADATVYPGAGETCDGRDNDCSGLADDDPACQPCEEKLVDGTRFLLCDLPMSWTDAEAFCRGMGAHLARIDDAEQSRIVYRAARARRRGPWWIGLTDRPSEGHFAWADGGPLVSARWARHQPDNDGCNEDCVALKDGAKGKWHDTHCAQRRPFVCR